MTASLYCETQRETVSEVTVAFNDKFTVPLDPVLYSSLGVIIVSAGVYCLSHNWRSRISLECGGVEVIWPLSVFSGPIC